MPENSGNFRNDTRFKPGQSGNPAGKPKGARHKLGQAFLEAMHDDFTKHGRETIERVREEKPDAYLKVVADLLPKEHGLDERTIDALTRADLALVLDAVRAAEEAQSDAGTGVVH